MILIDTSVLSLALRRTRPGTYEQRVRAALEDLVASEAPLGLPGIVVLEVLSGIRSERQFAELERHLLASFTIVLPGATEHVEAARLRNKCLSKGITASSPDCLIATQAISGGHELFTEDPDFTAIAKHSSLKLFKSRVEGGT